MHGQVRISHAALTLTTPPIVDAPKMHTQAETHTDHNLVTPFCSSLFLLVLFRLRQCAAA